MHRIHILCVWAYALFHSAVLSYSSGEVAFHFSITPFVMTEYLTYKVRILGMTPYPREPDSQILGFNYVILLPVVFSSPHLSMSGEVWIPLGMTD